MNNAIAGYKLHVRKKHSRGKTADATNFKLDGAKVLDYCSIILLGSDIYFP